MSNRVHLKEGVSLADIRPEARRILFAASPVWHEHNQELWVTSHKEGGHGVNSLHYSGYALDLRSRFFVGVGEIDAIVKKLQQALGRDYDVVYHRNHLHVEFDPKPREDDDAQIV